MPAALPIPTPPAEAEPPSDCPLCPRLMEFRRQNRLAFPAYANRPIEPLGPMTARLGIIGLAPGLHGANRTGRPFTGDHAGELLFSTLLATGFATGVYERDPADSLRLTDARILNAVRCVPPQNKPLPAEQATCRPFLAFEVARMPHLQGFVALGRIAQEAILRVLGLKPSAHPFAHGRAHALPEGRWLIDCYHCSRYNTQTGRLTAEMFHAVFASARERLLSRQPGQ